MLVNIKDVNVDANPTEASARSFNANFVNPEIDYQVN